VIAAFLKWWRRYEYQDWYYDYGDDPVKLTVAFNSADDMRSAILRGHAHWLRQQPWLARVVHRFTWCKGCREIRGGAGRSL
jgi:hypothetical protein